MRKYVIELKTDFDDEEKYEVIKRMMVRAARELYTTAALMSSDRQPDIALHSKDFFHGNEDIAYLDQQYDEQD
jgi:hypothetical protein